MTPASAGDEARNSDGAPGPTGGRPNLPCTDYLGPVVFENGRVFRAVFPDKAPLATDILSAGSIRTLMLEGVMAKAWLAEHQIAGAGVTIEMERAPFDIPCDRFTASCLWRALERWIDMTLRLEASGLCLADAHFGNFMLFARNDPRWVDIGSVRPIHHLPEELPFRRFKFLWQGMLTPLLVLHRHRHPRLARLAIGDFPYQSPSFVAGEPPLILEDLLDDERRALAAAIGPATGREALLSTLEFARRAIGERFAPPTEEPAPAAIDADVVRRLLEESRIRRVTCLGADVYVALRDMPGSFDFAVVDHDEGRLEQVAGSLPRRPKPRGNVALCLQHVMNRIFLRRPPTADAVIAHEPFARFAHESGTADSNIAAILAMLTERMAIVSAKPADVPRTTEVLRQSFAAVSPATAHGELAIIACYKQT